MVQEIPTGLGWRQVRQPKSLPAPSRIECTHICLKLQWDCIPKLLPSYLPTPLCPGFPVTGFYPHQGTASQTSR